MNLKELKTLAQQATHFLLLQQPLEITHAPGWERNGFPLPIKRQPARPDGSTTQDYRPLVILEYVQEALAKQSAEQAALDREIADAQVPGPPNK